MAQKRKMDAAPRLDEADRTLYSTFCGAANCLSQLYTQAMAQQKLSFQAGERHAFMPDIMSHIQHEIDYGGTDAHVSPRVHQHPQITNPFTNPVGPPSTGSYGQTAAGFPASVTSQNIEANSAGANRETNSASSNDTCMDMVSDSAGNEFCQ
ncbi:hypothetical protein BS78_03G179300 [Paspalum vaginatum]|nr:hypothetical protein BS78_03G179300 [Paspalum vaginatum]